MIFSDYPLIGLLAMLAFHPSGPIGVITCAAALVHFLHASFKPRVQLAPLYLVLPVAVVAVARGGLYVESTPAIFTVSVLFAVVAAIVFDWLLPGVQTLPQIRPGGLATASAIMHVQVPLADFILRVYYPTRPAP